MKNKISKRMRKVILLLIILLVICLSLFCKMFYAGLQPYDKIMLKRYIRRVTTVKTINNFCSIRIGMKYEELVKLEGIPDNNAASGIYIPEYFLFGGGSIQIAYDEVNGVSSVTYVENGFKIEPYLYSDGPKSTVLLSDRFRHKMFCKDCDKEKNKIVLPVSGFEAFYCKDEWEESLKSENTYLYVYNLTSSYNYALNIIKDPRTGKYFSTNEKTGKHGLNPGDFSGTKLNDDFSNIIECCIMDAEKMSYTFKPIDENAKCGEGNYKVALYVSKKFGDLWYRQNPDGTWSYKDVGVSDRDYDGDIIYNLREANAGVDVKFIGFFEVGGTDKIGNNLNQSKLK